jgi:biotin carboxylase
MPEVRPKLGVFWEDAAFSPLEIAEEARGFCDIVWVVGWSAIPISFPVKFLTRLGDVIDVGTQPEARIVERLAECGLNGVIAFTDPPQRLAATVAEHLGLPFHSPHTATLVSDKFAQRMALRAAGIPVPNFTRLRLSESADTLTEKMEGVNFPAVLKPQSGAGSRDTFLVEDIDDVRTRLETCADEDFILEEYIADRPNPASRFGADIVSVEMIVRDGVACHVAVSGRFRFAPPLRDTGGFMPSDLSGPDMRTVVDLATAASGALGVRHGVLHIEVKLSPDGPRIIEVNGRIGGGVPGLLSRVGGPPIMEWAMRLALSQDLGSIVEIPPSPVSFFRWLLAPVAAQEVRGVKGVNEARALPGIARISVNRQPGELVNAREGGTFGNVVALEGVVADHEELGQLLSDIDATLLLEFS